MKKYINTIIDDINKLKNFLGPQVWRMFWISLIFGILLFLIESSFIFVLQGFLRTIGLVGYGDVALPEWYPSMLIHTTLILIAFGLVRGFTYMVRYYLSGATAHMFNRLQRERILEYGLKYSEDVTSSNVIALFGVQVTQAADVLQGTTNFIINITACSLFFIYGLNIAPVETLLGVTALGILIIPLKKLNALIVEAGNGVRREWNNVNSTLVQGLKNHFFFKIYNLVDTEVQKGKIYLRDSEKHYRHFYKVSALNNHSPNILGIFIICMISFVSVRYLHTRPITLISFFYIFIRMTQGLSEASTALSNFRLHFASCKDLYLWHTRLESIKKIKAEQPKPEILHENPFKDNIELKVSNLTFHYPQQPNLFNNLNLSVKKGEILLIKGPSGAGKSSLLMLILGLIKPNEGQILFNQHPVEKIRPYLSGIIGYVGPEPYLIPGTIKENILFGIQEDNFPTDEMIIDAMNKAQLDTNKFGLNFYVAEQTTLSTGQKQRLAIARAILRKPKLLVLDEATANLDGETELNFTNSIRTLLDEVTTIIISHKPSFDKIATNILTLERHQ